jgi:hypothetical protein
MSGPKQEKCNATLDGQVCAFDARHRSEWHTNFDGRSWNDGDPGAKPHAEPTKAERRRQVEAMIAELPDVEGSALASAEPSPKQDSPPSDAAMQAARAAVKRAVWEMDCRKYLAEEIFWARAMDAFAAEQVTRYRQSFNSSDEKAVAREWLEYVFENRGKIGMGVMEQNIAMRVREYAEQRVKAEREAIARHVDDEDEDFPKHKLAAEIRARGRK